MRGGLGLTEARTGRVRRKTQQGWGGGEVKLLSGGALAPTTSLMLADGRTTAAERRRELQGRSDLRS